MRLNKNTPKPATSRGQILVEVYAAGVNPIDWKIRERYIPLKFPATLGGDFSGVIADVGEGVSGFKKGLEVYGYASVLGGGSGSFAEFVSADVEIMALKSKSKNLTHIEAGALPLSAWQALVDHIGLSKGKKILIHGGAGGIGSIAIQLAEHLGAYVATTVSAKDMQYIKELGADEAIDYKNQSFEDLLNDYDAVYDTVGGETYIKSFNVLRRGGIIVSMLEQPRPELMEQYRVNAIGQLTQVNSERLSKLAELIDQRVTKLHVDKTFPLEQAGEALAYLQSGHPRGKVVLKKKKN